MLKHTLDKPAAPARTVILGSGFIGGSAATRLRQDGSDVLALRRTDLDLLATDAADRLTAILREDDALLVVSAEAPCKTPDMLQRNIKMMAGICTAIERRPPRYVAYVSSDAVYGDEPLPLTETAPAAPGSLHGVMHLARELMLQQAVKDRPFGILRPTLVYGANDPHNGYGPNRFLRTALRDETIALFGNGEERRDHVCVEDLADLLCRMILRQSAGILNGATGEVHSFMAIAEQVIAMTGRGRIATSPRVGAMPHNGYRPFGIAAVQAAFPDFRFTPLDTGLAKMMAQVAHG